MNVVIVNDDKVSLNLQRLLLERSKIANAIVTMLNGREALDYLIKLKDQEVVNYPKLILLDIHMPEMDGWEFLERFKDLMSFFSKTRVIITSYTSEIKDLERARDYPVVMDFQNSGLSAEYLKNLKISSVTGILV